MDSLLDDNDSIPLIQKQLMKTLFNNPGMTQSKPVGSTTDENRLADEHEPDPLNLTEHAIYRRIVGSPMYTATRTRPDLLVVDSMLSSHWHDFRASSVVASKRALPYIYFNGKRMADGSGAGFS